MRQLLRGGLSSALLRPRMRCSRLVAAPSSLRSSSSTATSSGGGDTAAAAAAAAATTTMAAAAESAATTHFGFKDVPRAEKKALVRGVFSSVADSYDVMNDVMSGTLHRQWKSHFVSRLAPVPGVALLDVAGGTGDIAFRCAEAIARSPLAVDASVRSSITVCDINPNMLDVGRRRSEAALRGISSVELEFFEGDAERLQFDDASFDGYTIAFGIRNCTDIPAVLAEAYRVLRPGGRFMCLEFSHVAAPPPIPQIYDAYSFNVIPLMGKLIAGDESSYAYLVESIRRFPAQREFARMIRDAGFESVAYENLTFGVVAIHSGVKPLQT